MLRIMGMVPVTEGAASKAGMLAILSATHIHFNRAMMRLCVLGVLACGRAIGVFVHCKRDAAFLGVLP